jgi:hypothetical protein
MPKNLTSLMTITTKSWQKLFLFCLGVSASAAFCMKWMEHDLFLKDEKFTILGLELFYSREKVAAILSGLTPPVKTILQYHLSFDFAFMTGVYPGIAALCMIAKEKARATPIKKILYILAILQLGAWAADMTENYYLLRWIRGPVIGNEFGFYHFVVYFKWIIALVAVLLAIPFAAKRKNTQLSI